MQIDQSGNDQFVPEIFHRKGSVLRRQRLKDTGAASVLADHIRILIFFQMKTVLAREDRSVKCKISQILSPYP